MPPFPPWNGMHPLLVHFPIALLMTAPIFVIIGLLPHAACRPFRWAGLALMVLGTIGAYVAVASGEATEHVIVRTREVGRVIGDHRELAEKSRLAFTVLTLAFAGMLLLPRMMKKEMDRRLEAGLTIAYLALYGWGVLGLAQAAHRGGELVHVHGVRAWATAKQPGAEARQGE